MDSWNNRSALFGNIILSAKLSSGGSELRQRNIYVLFLYNFVQIPFDM